MAGDARYIRLLLAFGLRAFSVHPRVLLVVKSIINATDVSAVSPMAEPFLATLNPRARATLMEQINAGAPGMP
jgi:phosphoenolpyruvate-protein kinase (PTS system EI component)